jgi:hypothetical protein
MAILDSAAERQYTNKAWEASNKMSVDVERAHSKKKALIEGYKKHVFEGSSKPVNLIERFENDKYKELQFALYADNLMRSVAEARNGGKLDETSRASMPVWTRNSLALISATVADDMLEYVASVQPMSNRTSKIHYLDVVAERAKGQIQDYQRIFDSLAGFAGTTDYSTKKIIREQIGVAGSTSYTPTLQYNPIIPGTVAVIAGAVELIDDGNGNLVGAGGSGTYNILTGVVSITLTSPATDVVLCNYSYNIEAANHFPEVGINLRSVTVEAMPIALASNWSVQAVYDFLNDYSIDLEPTLMDSLTKVLQAERFKRLVNQLTQQGTGGDFFFSNTSPAGVPYQLHLKTFSILLTRAQAAVWQKTQVIRPNVMVISPDVWFLIQNQDGWVGEAKTANDGIAGPRVIGKLTNHGITVICDPNHPAGTMLLTYKGETFVSTACIIGMYIPLYRSPVHQQAFQKDVAILSEYATHIVDSNHICRLAVTDL